MGPGIPQNLQDKCPISVPFLNVNTSGLPLIPLEHGNLKFVGLLDSGSVLNLINPSILNKISSPLIVNESINIKTVDSSILLNQRVNLNLNIGMRIFNIPFWISTSDISHSFDFLLGSSFLSENCCRLNFVSNTLEIFKPFFKYVTHTHTEPRSNINNNNNNSVAEREIKLNTTVGTQQIGCQNLESPVISNIPQHLNLDMSITPQDLNNTNHKNVNNNMLNTFSDTSPVDIDNTLPKVVISDHNITNNDLIVNNKYNNTNINAPFNNHLYVNKKVIIPPMSQKIVYTNIKDSQRLNSELYFIEPLPNILDNNILISKSIAINSSNINIPVLVLNYTPQPLTLNKHKYIACVEPLVDAIDSHAEVFSNQFGECCEADLTWSSEFDLSHLNDDLQSKLRVLLEKNKTVFAGSVLDLEGCDTVLHEVNLTDSIPVKRKPYRPPYYLKDELDRQINLLLEAGILAPSTSAYCSPVCLVKKSSGEFRLVADFRHLNKKIVKDSYPLPLIQENIDNLATCKFFSTLDLTSGFHQQVIKPSDRHKLAIGTPNGLFQYTRSPFGLATSPPAFQRLMHVVLSGLSPLNISCYLDDIIVASDTEQSNLDKLQIVFDRLKLHRLKLKPSKCVFLKQEIEFLGFVVSGTTLKPKSKNLETINRFKVPKSKKDVQSFLGAINYYRRLIPDFSKRAVTLTNLTKNSDKFVWTDEAQFEFDDLRFALNNAPCLALPDMSKEFVLYTDASKFAVGCVIAQLNEDNFPQPVAFASKKLNHAQVRYSTTEREIFAIVWGVNYFKYFLQGTHFKVFTDHHSLTNMLKLRDPTNRIARWAVSLGNFDFETVFIKGKSNSVADFLSRSIDVTQEIHPVLLADVPINSSVTLTMQGDLIQKIKSGQTNDEFCRDIISKLEAKNLKPQGFHFFMDDGILKCLKRKQSHNRDFQEKLVVPQQLIEEVLQICHDSVTSCHPGFLKTLMKVRHHFFFPSMSKIVKSYIKSCIMCNRRRAHKPHFVVPLQRRPISEGPSTHLSVDFVGPLPVTAKGNRYALFFTDFFTRYTVVFPTSDLTSETVAHCLLDYISKFGCPKLITSDRGSSFLSEATKYVYSALGIKHIATSSYHSSGNSVNERCHFTIEDNLAFIVNDSATDWDIKMNFALLAYNTSLHLSTGFAPCYLMFGREFQLSSLMEFNTQRSYSEVDSFAKELVADMQLTYKSVRENLTKAAQAMEERVLKQARLKSIKVGDQVFLHYPSLGISSSRKFALPNKGPYCVTAQVSPVNFKIQNVNKPSDIQVVHINRLSPYTPRLAFSEDKSSPADPGIPDEQTFVKQAQVNDTVPDVNISEGTQSPTVSHGYNLRKRDNGFVTSI